MDDKLAEVIINEIRENRSDIKSLSSKLNDMDKHIFANKMKLTIFIGGATLLFNVVVAVITTKIKNLF